MRRLIVTVALFLPALANAAAEKTWTPLVRGNVPAGEAKGAAPTSRGTIEPAPESKELSAPASPYLWAITISSGVVFAGSGDSGEVWRVLKAGNPLAIREWKDMVRPDVTFVNRQRGAGTRVLLDVRLADAKLDARSIRGYSREEPTHMAVAAAVAGGVADAGLCIEAAARHLALDFVPLEDEPFDLVVPEKHLAHAGVSALLELIATDAFRRAASAVPGYDATTSGSYVSR